MALQNMKKKLFKTEIVLKWYSPVAKEVRWDLEYSRLRLIGIHRAPNFCPD